MTVPERHQLKIARQTMQMDDTMALVIGGPSKSEAARIIYDLTGKWPNNWEEPEKEPASPESEV